MRIGTLVATPLNSLVVLADGPVKSIADLKGRKVGFSVGGFEEALLGAMLEQARAEAGRRRAGQRQLLAVAGADRGQVDAVIGAFRNFELNQMELVGRPGPRLLPRGGGRAGL